MYKVRVNAGTAVHCWCLRAEANRITMYVVCGNADSVCGHCMVPHWHHPTAEQSRVAQTIHFSPFLYDEVILSSHKKEQKAFSGLHNAKC